MNEITYKLVYVVSVGLEYYKTRFWGLCRKNANFCSLMLLCLLKMTSIYS